ncbi:peptidase domain-containing ABC transporter [Chryseobacterium sp. 09-1422]|uniref:Peptidase domain-containing ABC transporter n=1 Tax=Chryseobacterium kimseyorum TaxID=2984028 RepID=A0ABT3I230_9FLAO|nr:peptidase domain-containing ABC transporter [Chryseobacterium kimseyorum]MCW3170102.1 peptidase domain-containing ABC transporter [Chryseobacterium kimseyorum]
MAKITYYRQLDSMDCGPTCLRIITQYFGKKFSSEYLRLITFQSRTGVSFHDLIAASQELRLETLAVEISFGKLMSEAPKPCILHWKNDHFVVLVPQQKSGKITVADPEYGRLDLSEEEFKENWLQENSTGKALLFETTEAFFQKKEDQSVNGFKFLFKYLKPHRKALIFLLFTLLITSVITLIFPFLTQNLVDKAIKFKDKNLVLMIVGAQIVLFLGNSFMDLIRSWIMLKVNTKVNIRLISDFIGKLIHLPVAYFESKRVGDIQQRILDHQRISSFLSTNTLAILFSFINLLVFSVVLGTYNLIILILFFTFSFLSVVWIFIFLNKRKVLDQKEFILNSQNQNILNEMVLGMAEIKINQSENFQQAKWENVQQELFERNKKALKLSQYQMIGSGFISQLKNILITGFSAYAVIDGDLTLGMMLAISFIVGQMNSPFDQLLYVIQITQDAKLSLERIAEVHTKPVENTLEESRQTINNEDLVLENVDFGFGDFQILKNLNVKIPKGKITAIVGESGSGKTTLFKLLLRFYEPDQGSITYGNQNLSEIPLADWRETTGTVMQEGFIFSDTIRKNITLKSDNIDENLLTYAVKIANLEKFVQKHPQGLDTLVGNDGINLSTGQKQRILIARSVYRNPDIFLLDEATSALDTQNEKEIMENLFEFFQGKTVLIIAHRLSTVKNADQILVLHDGTFVESGNHQELLEKKSYYYNLVSNQLGI